jgi:hypothetical protein
VTQFPLDVERFEEALEQLWPRWDHDQDGATPRLHTVCPPACAAGLARVTHRRQLAWGELCYNLARAREARLGALLSPVHTWRRLHCAAPCDPQAPSRALSSSVRRWGFSTSYAPTCCGSASPSCRCPISRRSACAGSSTLTRTRRARSSRRSWCAPPLAKTCHAYAWHAHPHGHARTSCLCQVRALIKTYSLASDLGQVRQMRELVSAVWPLFDLNGTGRVSQQEFLRPGDGLADAIIASRAS